MSFADSLNEAAKRPDSSEFNPLNLFSAPGVIDGARVVTEERSPGQIPGVPEYALKYHSRRFYMGTELAEIDGAQKIFKDRDESEELAEVMDLCLSGKAVILKRNETFLQNGSFVIYLEYGVYVERELPPLEERDYMTEKELRTPSSRDPREHALELLAQEALKGMADPAAEEPTVEADTEEPWGEPSDGQGPEDENSDE